MAKKKKKSAGKAPLKYVQTVTRSKGKVRAKVTKVKPQLDAQQEKLDRSFVVSTVSHPDWALLSGIERFGNDGDCDGPTVFLFDSAAEAEAFIVRKREAGAEVSGILPHDMTVKPARDLLAVHYEFEDPPADWKLYSEFRWKADYLVSRKDAIKSQRSDLAMDIKREKAELKRLQREFVSEEKAYTRDVEHAEKRLARFQKVHG